MKSKYLYAGLGIVVVVLLSYAFGVGIFNKQNISINQQQKPQVSASFYTLSYFASQIAGDKANVINITPAGAECPMDYDITTQDAKRMEDSKLVILNGGKLEGWGDNIKQNIDPKNTTVIEVGQGLTNRMFVDDDGINKVDPHIWLNPLLAEKMVDRISQGFIGIDPIHADYYLANANNLKTKLENLDKEYKQGLNNCASRDIITSHAAFGYLAAAYGLRQVPIAGLSPDAEPSPKEMADIVQFAKANKVKYVFFESIASPKLSDTIATEVGAKTLVLNPIEGITDDRVAKGANYFTEMENNLTNLRTALQCQ